MGRTEVNVINFSFFDINTILLMTEDYSPVNKMIQKKKIHADIGLRNPM